MPLGEVPLDVVPLGKVPLDVVPLGEVPLDVVPLGEVPLDMEVPLGEEVPLEGEVPLEEEPRDVVPLGEVPLDVVPLGKVPLDLVPLGEVPLDREVPLGEEVPLEEEEPLEEVPPGEVVSREDKPALDKPAEVMAAQGELMENKLEVCRRGIKQQHHRQPQEGSVLNNKSRNIPEVVFVRRWAVGVLGIWREGVGWERGGSRWVSLSPTWD